MKVTEKNQIYRCRFCGNIIQVINEGEGQLYCCGRPMELLVNDANGNPEGHTFEETDN